MALTFPVSWTRSTKPIAAPVSPKSKRTAKAILPWVRTQVLKNHYYYPHKPCPFQAKFWDADSETFLCEIFKGPALGMVKAALGFGGASSSSDKDEL